MGEKFQNLIGREVLSPPARVQFPHIAEPDVGGQYSDNKYKCFLLFDQEETDFDQMLDVVNDLSRLSFGVDATEIEEVPFKKGDDKKWQGFPGSIYISAKSKFPVDVWSPTKDANGQFFKLDPKKVYAGCIVQACLSPYSYLSKGQRGITFLLNFLQFCEDAPRFSTMALKDARDILPEYIPRAARGASQVLNGAPESARAAQSSDTPVDDGGGEDEGVSEAPVKASGLPISGQKKRGPKPKNPMAGLGKSAETPLPAEATGGETPSQAARRKAAEMKNADQANGTYPEKGVQNLPAAVAAQPAAAKKSLMDML